MNQIVPHLIERKQLDGVHNWYNMPYWIVPMLDHPIPLMVPYVIYSQFPFSVHSDIPMVDWMHLLYIDIIDMHIVMISDVYFPIIII